MITATLEGPSLWRWDLIFCRGSGTRTAVSGLNLHAAANYVLEEKKRLGDHR